MKRFGPAILILGILWLALSDLGSAPLRTDPSIHVISIDGMKFSPAVITVHLGDSIEFRNVDFVPHTVTEQGRPSFDSGILKRNETWKMAISQTGTLRYRCLFHPEMTGAIIVGEESSSASVRAPAAVELCGGK